MQLRHWIGVGLAVVLVAGYFYWVHTGGGSAPTASSTPTVSVTASSTGGYTTTPGSTEKLTVSGVASTIVGSWTATGDPISATFTANNQVTIMVSTTTASGTYQLYTDTDAPADLSGVTLEPGGVFLRMSFQGQTPEDFFVSTADQENLVVGPIGAAGVISFTRTK